MQLSALHNVKILILSSYKNNPWRKGSIRGTIQGGNNNYSLKVPQFNNYDLTRRQCIYNIKAWTKLDSRPAIILIVRIWQSN